MNAQYYREYYALERKHWWFQAREGLLMAHLSRVFDGQAAPDPPRRILNIGAATGRTSEWLSHFGEVVSVEYDRACCLFMREQQGMEMIQASVLDLPFDDASFDLVCAFDVIEHVADDGLAVQEMRRVCRTGGKLCITVPAFAFLWSRHDDVNHHFRRYTSGQIRRLFGAPDQCEYLSYFNWWLFIPIAVFRLSARWLPLQTGRRTDAGSDFFVMAGPAIQKIFYHIFRSERFFIANGIRLPAGVSLLATWRR